MEDRAGGFIVCKKAFSDYLPRNRALPHENLHLFVSHYLFLSGFRIRCHEATSVPMTSGQTSMQALYS